MSDYNPRAPGPVYDPRAQAPVDPRYEPQQDVAAGRSTELNEYAMTPDETADADLLYEELKPMAVDGAREFVLARTKAEWQEYMITKIDADWPVPPVEDPGVMIRVQGEQGRVSIQAPAISPDSPVREFKGQKVDPIRLKLDTGRDRNMRRAAP